MIPEKSKIYLYFRARGYGHGVSEWLVKQAVLETGNFTSPAYRNNKNAWGMGRVSRRPTTQVSARDAQDGTGQNTIGIYPSVFASHRDRVLFDAWYLPRYVAFKARQGVAISEKEVKRDTAMYTKYIDWTPYNARENYGKSVTAISHSSAKLRVLLSVAVLGVTATLLFLLWKKYLKK